LCENGRVDGFGTDGTSISSWEHSRGASGGSKKS
jgi:hypothetical protein